jgi:hypothetical protein
MQNIKVYLENLAQQANTGADDLPPHFAEGALGISMIKSNNPNQQSVTRIETARIPYITRILIPFLENLT